MCTHPLRMTYITCILIINGVTGLQKWFLQEREGILVQLETYEQLEGLGMSVRRAHI